MKRSYVYLSIAIVFLLVAIGYAQTTLSGSSMGFTTSSGTCQAPTSGISILCGTSAGFQQSINGAAYAGISGTPGPVGPQGPAGPTGATGPQGPAGAAPSTLTCTGFSVAQGGAIQLTGCH